jgi:hypothetical protein
MRSQRQKTMTNENRTMKCKLSTMQLLPEDINTILAALRYYQEGLTAGYRPSVAIEDIATNGWSCREYNEFDIDWLCERINFGLPPDTPR